MSLMADDEEQGVSGLNERGREEEKSCEVMHADRREGAQPCNS